MKNYFISVGDALSQLLNVLLFCSSNPNESISGRAYRQRDSRVWGVAYRWINAAFRALLGQENHCRAAYRADLSRASEMLRSHRDE